MRSCKAATGTLGLWPKYPRHVLVTFEGTEGSGKTTLIRALVERLRRQGVDVVSTREPGEGELGAQVRQALLHGGSLTPLAEAFLFLADRAQHCAEVIGPALGAGKLVLCDRFADSTIVYQGYGRGLDVEMLRRWNLEAAGSVWPDLTILLDLPVEVGLDRLSNRDRIDREPVEFHERIRAGFLAEARREPRWAVLDAREGAETVIQEALRMILSHPAFGERLPRTDRA